MWFLSYVFFFFNDTATTEIYTLSLHDALPISEALRGDVGGGAEHLAVGVRVGLARGGGDAEVEHLHPGRGEHDVRGLDVRSEEHTSELQSRQYLVCRLLLEKKKNKDIPLSYHI